MGKFRAPASASAPQENMAPECSGFSSSSGSLLLRKAYNKLETEISNLMKFFIIVCLFMFEKKFLGLGESSVSKIVWKRPIAVDGDDAAVGITDKRMFMYFNDIPPGHKLIRKLFKEAIIEMYGSKFFKTFCEHYFFINIIISDFTSH